jgi:putative transposase
MLHSAAQEHVAMGPNQVWSWDITYLPTVIRGRFFYLYLILDIYSRRIMGWTVQAVESAEHAAALFRATCDAQPVDPHGLILRSDNGGPMRGSTLLATLQWLGIVTSFSRPATSSDNPFSEALFRTLKYRPTWPSKPFASVEQARDWVASFVAWYNSEHRHSALRFVTPNERHDGREGAILAHRTRVYEQARRRRPERWSGTIRNWMPIGPVRLGSRDAYAANASSRKEVLAA